MAQGSVLDWFDAQKATADSGAISPGAKSSGTALDWFDAQAGFKPRSRTPTGAGFEIDAPGQLFQGPRVSEIPAGDLPARRPGREVEGPPSTAEHVGAKLAGGFSGAIESSVGMLGRLREKAIGAGVPRILAGGPAGLLYDALPQLNQQEAAAATQRGLGIQADPTRADEFWASKVPEGLGGTLGFGAQVAATGPLGPALGLGTKGAALASGAGIGALGGSEEAFQRTLQETGDESRAWKAALIGGALGTTEAADVLVAGGLGKGLAKINGKLGGLLTDLVFGSLLEAGQEGTQQALAGIAARRLDDEDRSFLEDVQASIPEGVEGAKIGGAIGLLLGGGGAAARSLAGEGGRGQGAEELPKGSRKTPVAPRTSPADIQLPDVYGERPAVDVAEAPLSVIADEMAPPPAQETGHGAGELPSLERSSVETTLPQAPESGKVGEATVPGAERRSEVRLGVERRQDVERRKLVEEMTHEERGAALLTSEKAGIPNRRAFEEARDRGELKGKVFAAYDGDGFGFYNKAFGHEGGDEIIKAMGRAAKGETGVYHMSGDEFLATGDSLQDAKAKIARIKERARREVYSQELAEEPGKIGTAHGLEVTEGYGATYKEADVASGRKKKLKQILGLRAAKEQQPLHFEVSEKPSQPAPTEAPRETAGAEDPRKAEIARLRKEHAEALAIPLASEGGISPAQLGMMSKRQHERYMRLVQERIDVERQIQELEKTPEQLEADEARTSEKEKSSRLTQIESRLEDLRRVGVGKSGKIKPTYQREIDKLEAERAELTAQKAPEPTEQKAPSLFKKPAPAEAAKPESPHSVMYRTEGMRTASLEQFETKAEADAFASKVRSEKGGQYAVVREKGGVFPRTRKELMAEGGATKKAPGLPLFKKPPTEAQGIGENRRRIRELTQDYVEAESSGNRREMDAANKAIVEIRREHEAGLTKEDFFPGYHEAVARHAAEIGEKASKPSPGLPLLKKPPKSKEAGAMDLFGQPKKKQPEKPKVDKLGFYSPIEKALLEKMPDKAPAFQVKNIAKQAQPREYEFSGLEEFLEGKAHVTKAEVRKFLEENNVRVEEVESGKRRELTKAEKDEMIRLGLTSPMTQQQLNRYNELNATELGTATKFGQYQLPGGSNYRELRLTMPSREDAGRKAIFDRYAPTIEYFNRESQSAATPEARERARQRREQEEARRDEDADEVARASGKAFYGGHFPEPNVLAHVRFNERTDAQGRKTLFLEEIQSDWAARAEREGVVGTPEQQKARGEEMARLQSPANRWLDKLDDLGFDSRGRAYSAILQHEDWATRWDVKGEVERGQLDQRAIDDIDAWREAALKWQGGQKGVPNMPFKTREQYAKLALRRMIRYAAENGYDSVSWTTGEQQAERYDLSKQLDSVAWTPAKTPQGAEEYGQLIGNKGDRTLIDERIPKAKLADYVGKDVADKIIAQTPDALGRHWLEGVDLKVGGEGMRAFYDRTLPKVANEIAKKWGAKAERSDVQTGSSSRFAVEPTEDGRWRVLDRKAGPHAYATQEAFKTPEEAGNWIRSSGIAKATVHTLRLPDTMRESVMKEGQPRLGRMDLFGPRKPKPTRAANGDGAFDVPEEDWRDRAYRAVVNDFERIVQLEKAAPEKVSGTDLEHALSQLPGLKFGESEKLQKLVVDPAKRYMAEHSIPPIESTAEKASASDYLYAIHAKDMARFEGVETGMSEAEADAILAKAGPEYKKLQDWNRALNVKRLDLLESSGLISEAQRKAWEEKYGQDYVPLRTAKDPFETLFGGKSLAISGKESKARKGRSSKADSPLAFAVETMQTAIDRSESNKIGRKLGELVRKNPQPGLWRIETDANKIKEGEERLPFKEAGEQRYIVTSDKGLAESFKRITKPDPGVIKVIDPLLKYWHATLIRYNPVFPLTNMPRDVGTATIRHMIHGDVGAAMSTVKNSVPAAIGAYQAIRTEGAGGKWGKVYREARDAGALIGWRDVLNHEQRIKDFERAFKTAKGPVGHLKALGQLMDDWNRATELGSRLTTFDAMKRAGKTDAEAAMAARRITADFARRGSLAPIYRRIYLFSGANVQGITEAVRSVAKNPKRAATVLGALTASGFINYQMSKLYGDDHELDKLNESDKIRFFGPMIGKRRYGFAAPYTFSIFPYMGWKLGELMDGRASKSKALGDVVSHGFDAMSPLPQGANAMQSLTPTLFRPAMEIAQNRTFSDAPIAPDEDPYAKVQKPDAQRFFRSVSPAAKEIAQGLSALTGGTKVKPGLIDISPETIEHLAQAAGGGLGTFAGRTTEVIRKALSGEADEIRLSDIPVVRPFVHETSRGAEGVLFRKNVEAIELNKAQKKAGEEPDNWEATSYGVTESAKEAEKKIRELYKKMDAAGMTDADRKEIQKMIDEVRERFNRRVKPVLQGR